MGAVSSFAYQGTNSHALLAAAGPMALAAPQPWVWQRSRLWYQVTSHPLLLRVARGPRGMGGAPADVHVACALRRAALSYLLDHSVQGRAVVPNALLLEMASAAGQLLWSQEWTDNPVAVTGAAFQQPLLLAPAGEAVVTCTISPSTGVASLSSRALPTSQAMPAHMRVQLQAIEGPVAAAQPTGAQAAAAGLGHTPSLRLAVAVLSGVRGAAADSSSMAFAAVLADQHQHTGYWVHPAVADASLQLAAALRAPASSPAPLLVSAALAAYAPMQRMAAASAGAGTAAGLGGSSSSHWLGGPTHQILSIIDNQFKTLAALQALAAAADAVAAQLPFLPAVVAASPAGMLPALTLLSSPGTVPGGGVGAIVQQLQEVVAGVLGRADIPTDQPLMETGLDSIGECKRLHICGGQRLAELSML